MVQEAARVDRGHLPRHGSVDFLRWWDLDCMAMEMGYGDGGESN